MSPYTEKFLRWLQPSQYSEFRRPANLSPCIFPVSYIEQTASVCKDSSPFPRTWQMYFSSSDLLGRLYSGWVWGIEMRSCIMLKNLPGREFQIQQTCYRILQRLTQRKWWTLFRWYLVFVCSACLCHLWMKFPLKWDREEYFRCVYKSLTVQNFPHFGEVGLS